MKCMYPEIYPFCDQWIGHHLSLSIHVIHELSLPLEDLQPCHAGALP